MRGNLSRNNSHERYQPFPSVPLSGRRWPDRRIERAPRWLSTDLRDGNQALIDPMTPARKLRMFELLVRMGYREIEVGFPAASRHDFDFVRRLIEEDRIPSDVRISVLTQAREDVIDRTVEALSGAPRATLHLYNATAPQFRRVVFGIDREECVRIATRGTAQVMRLAESALSECDLGFEYSPEVFTETELDFALEICGAVADLWQPGPGREIILNFPATVERATPNVFADQIEWLDRNLPYREYACLSVHPHNDRGTAVAATELALMAGAERVEGCLFGNGERTGNVCLVTLGLNLFSQGVDPGIDFSDLDAARRVVEECTQLPVHPRHPYAGELVYTAFSGAHQDAINKGFESLRRDAAAAEVPVERFRWDMPYLPIDPKDVGRTYDAVVRVNSQSGKGGVAYVLKTEHGVDLPRPLQIELSKAVQAHTDAVGGEVTPRALWETFAREYLDPGSGIDLVHHQTRREDDGYLVSAEVRSAGIRRLVRGAGYDPVSAFTDALRVLGVRAEVLEIRVQDDRTRDGDVAAYVRCRAEGAAAWGAGIASNTDSASLRAVLSAVRRLTGRPSEERNEDPIAAAAPRRRRGVAGRRRTPLRVNG